MHSNSHSYEALLYTWGSPDNTESIWISENDDSNMAEAVTQLASGVQSLSVTTNYEGKAFMFIRQNLFVALRYLRLHDVP